MLLRSKIKGMNDPGSRDCEAVPHTTLQEDTGEDAEYELTVEEAERILQETSYLSDFESEPGSPKAPQDEQLVVRIKQEAEDVDVSEDWYQYVEDEPNKDAAVPLPEKDANQQQPPELLTPQLCEIQQIKKEPVELSSSESFNIQSGKGGLPPPSFFVANQLLEMSQNMMKAVNNGLNKYNRKKRHHVTTREDFLKALNSKLPMKKRKNQMAQETKYLRKTRPTISMKESRHSSRLKQVGYKIHDDIDPESLKIIKEMLLGYESDEEDGVDKFKKKVKKMRKEKEPVSDKLIKKKKKRGKISGRVMLSPEEVTDDMLKKVTFRSVGKVYDSENGSCCHQCRQKTVDMKTICRSKTCVGVRGQFCGFCLANRYGENAATALKDPNWKCPACRGLCNCSICRTREGKLPTGIMAPFVRERGFVSVSEYLKQHELMEKIKEEQQEEAAPAVATAAVDFNVRIEQEPDDSAAKIDAKIDHVPDKAPAVATAEMKVSIKQEPDDSAAETDMEIDQESNEAPAIATAAAEVEVKIKQEPEEVVADVEGQ